MQRFAEILVATSRGILKKIIILSPRADAKFGSRWQPVVEAPLAVLGETGERHEPST
jgi:hypothetical protein